MMQNEPTNRRLCAWTVLTLLVAIALITGCRTIELVDESPVGRLRVMTYNIWVGGQAGGHPLEQTAAVIRRARADVVGVQELIRRGADRGREDTGPLLAEMLDWHYQHLYRGNGILSRFPITAVTPERTGARLRLRAGQHIWVFNVHLTAQPYQPYQLAGIAYGEYPFVSTEAEAINHARRYRVPQMAAALKDMTEALAGDEPVFLTGDFNEPSHLDWTQRAARAGLCAIKVAYPTSLTVQQAGFVDAYRAIYPDEVRHPGHTWTPRRPAPDKREVHDRIDRVYYRGNGVKAVDAKVIGEDDLHADHVVRPYPSDHRAVMAEFEYSRLHRNVP